MRQDHPQSSGVKEPAADDGRSGSRVEAPINPLRILIVAPSFDILGGQSVQAARLLARLRDEPSLSVDFLPINPRLPGRLRTLQAVKYLRTFVTSLLYLATLLAEVRKYDVIHIFSASYFSFLLAPTPAILVARLYGKKTLLNYHSGEAEDHLARWKRSALPMIKSVDEIAVPSEYLVAVFSKFGLRAQSIYNLIETEEFSFRQRSPLRPNFLSNRNLEAHYGVDTILRAFAIIQQRISDASLTVVGDGSQRSSLEQLAGELCLRNISFKGQVSHQTIIQQYAATDIYLNGSEIDNQPLSILEAFACGLPVVTTDAGGIPYIVADGETGLIVKRRDYEAMAESAIRLLKEPELAQSICERARNECQKYSWDSVRDKWMDLYYELANRNEASAIVLSELEAREQAISSEPKTARR